MSLLFKLQNIGFALSVGTLSVLAVNVEPAQAETIKYQRGNTQPTDVTVVRWKSHDYKGNDLEVDNSTLECNEQGVRWSNYPVKVCRVKYYTPEYGFEYMHFASHMKPITVKGFTAYATVEEWTKNKRMINANRLTPSMFTVGRDGGNCDDFTMNTPQGYSLVTDGGFYYHFFSPIR